MNPPPEALACPLCGEIENYVFIDGTDEQLTISNVGSSRTHLSAGQILRCSACSFAFRRFRPRERELASLYSEADVHLYEHESGGRLLTAGRHARLIERYHGPPGRLLDVGCASGVFLSLMSERGWEVEGVEPSRRHFLNASHAVGGKGRLQQCSLQQAQFGEKFHVLTLWDVLEHVPDPLEFLNLCRELLTSRGFLFLNVPDMDSLQARLLKRRWPLLLAEHLNYFNRASLERCCRSAGFTWIATGRRPVYFSTWYVIYRLSQHFCSTALRFRWLQESPLGRITVPVWMGERYAILQKP